MKLNVLNQQKKLLFFSFIFLLSQTSCLPLLQTRKGISKKQENTDCPLFYPELNLCAEITPDSPPARVNDIQQLYTLKFWIRGEGSSTENFANLGELIGDEPLVPFIRLYMEMDAGSHPGGTPSPIATLKEPGVYSVISLNFTMKSEGGTWWVYVALKNGKNEMFTTDVRCEIDVP